MTKLSEKLYICMAQLILTEDKNKKITDYLNRNSWVLLWNCLISSLFFF